MWFTSADIEKKLKTTFIGNDIVNNLTGGMLHNKVIGGSYISLTITETYKDDYPYVFSSMKTTLQYGGLLLEF